MSSAAVWVQCTAVNGPPPTASRITAIGGPPYAPTHSSISRRCSSTCRWTGMPRRRPSAWMAAISLGLAARMLCGATPIDWVAGSSAGISRSTWRQKPVHRGRGEPALGALERTTGRPGGVVAVQQHHPDAHVARRLDHGLVQREIALALVMDVVELADRGDAGIAHLGEGAGADPAERSLVERADQGIHRFPPGPEASRAPGKRLSLAAEAALKRVRMGIDESRQQRDVAQRLGVGAAELADGLDPPIRSHGDLDARDEAPVDPGQGRRERSTHRRAQLRWMTWSRISPAR